MMEEEEKCVCIDRIRIKSEAATSEWNNIPSSL